MTAHSFNPMFDESGSMGDIGIECFTTFKLEKVRVVAFCECYTELFLATIIRVFFERGCFLQLTRGHRAW